MSAGRSVVDTDVLVVGAGVAGLAAAHAAATAGARVIVLARGAAGDVGAGKTPGGLAVALGETDSPALHAADTRAAGAGLTVGRAADALAGDAPERLGELLGLGARFDRDGRGGLALAPDRGHSAARTVTAADATGAEVARTLRRAVAADGVDLVERTLLLDLLLDGARVGGAVALDAHGRRVVYRAGTVVLATGGSGRMFAATTNPPEATADGLAAAARAGAVLRDLELVQFQPTALAVPGADPLPLLPEALRRDGATLVDEMNHRFLLDVHPDGERAPAHLVARAIVSHQLAGHAVHLDTRATIGDGLPTRFPTVFAAGLAHGIDVVRQPAPVQPAAHLHLGGVATDRDGRSSLDGLLAAGEVAATGAHGAEPLTGNSLLEAVVFGARAGASAATDASGAPRAVDAASVEAARARWAHVRPGPVSGRRVESTTVTELRRVMTRQVGPVRDRRGLVDAVRRLDALERPGLDPDAANLLLAARLVARAALLRTESRGVHQRSDHPRTDGTWTGHVDVRRHDDGHVSLTAGTSDGVRS